MLEEKFVTFIDASSNEEKVHYKTWKRSNRLSLMLMRMTVADSIKTTLPKIESAKKFMGLVGEYSQTADKSVVGTLMNTLTTMKFDGSFNLHVNVYILTVGNCRRSSISICKYFCNAIFFWRKIVVMGYFEVSMLLSKKQIVGNH